MRLKFDLWWRIVMDVGGWPYYKWYQSLSGEILPHFYVKNIFLAQKLTKLEQFIENLSTFQKEIAKNLKNKFLNIIWSILDPFKLSHTEVRKIAWAVIKETMQYEVMYYL